MFCPRCGGEQASGNMRFCSRCGFPLGGVLNLLATGGDTGDSALVRPQNPSLYRRIVSLRGTKVLFASFVSIPLAIIMAAVVDSPGPLILPFLLFVIGLAHVMYKMIFGTVLTPEHDQTYHPLNAGSRYDLPPVQSSFIPAEPTFRADTGKMAPPSVTEPTTNLLDPDEIKRY